MRVYAILALTMITGLLLSACQPCVSPEGPSREEDRPLAAVSEIELAGEVYVLLVPSDTPFLVVSGSDNIRQLIHTDQRGQTLRISTEGCISNEGQSQVRVGMAGLDQVIVGGSGLVTTEALFSSEAVHVGISGSGEARLHLNAERVSTSISGSGRIELIGITDHLKVNVAGSGELLGKEFQADNCEVLVAGSGSAQVSAGRHLRARVNGSGMVKYAGDPQLDIRVTGSGEIVKIH
ncbi:MAG TPA: head GIN domain-containing protein [Bacteroidales bacterium]|nr:head GIN domain-containing protein [Bacteroidales bacterium]